MKSSESGTNISDLEVTNISEHGFWLWIRGQEYFLPFAHYPWFIKATIQQITHVEMAHNNHLYWPDLDVDLSVGILDEPEKYPLVWKAG